MVRNREASSSNKERGGRSDRRRPESQLDGGFPSLVSVSAEALHLAKWAAWGLNFPAVVAQLGSSSPVPPRAFEFYSIMPQASGNALPAILRGMFLDDCALCTTQDVDTAFGSVLAGRVAVTLEMHGVEPTTARRCLRAER